MSKKVKIILMFLLISFISDLSLSQTTDAVVLPIPKIGWDSLQNKIVFTEIEKRAMLWGAYEINLEIDSVGKMTKYNIKIPNFDSDKYKKNLDKDHQAFIRYLQIVFQDIKWIPGEIDNQPKTMSLTVPIVFYFIDRRGSSPTLFIKSKPSYLSQ